MCKTCKISQNFWIQMKLGEAGVWLLGSVLSKSLKKCWWIGSLKIVPATLTISGIISAVSSEANLKVREKKPICPVNEKHNNGSQYFSEVWILGLFIKATEFLKTQEGILPGIIFPWDCCKIHGLGLVFQIVVTCWHSIVGLFLESGQGTCHRAYAVRFFSVVI